MTGRKCGTCKHFEPAPLWRMGWCRNPLLYSPQQSHLVSDEDLDCERGMGNYWEASEPVYADSMDTFSEGFQEPVADIMGQASRGQYPLVSASGQPVYPVTGAAGQGGDRPPYGDQPGGGWSGGGQPPNSGDRDYNYYPEERYWTDYLRIAAPILGVILMVLLFWLWISSFLGDDDNDNGDLAGGGTTPATLATVLDTPAPGTTVTPDNSTPGTIVLPGETPGADGTTGETPPPGDEPPATGGAITEGSTVQVVNTGGTGVNVRSEASTDSEIISVFLDGTVLTVTGPSVAAEDFVWWPVQAEDGVQGYVVEEYLAVTE